MSIDLKAFLQDLKELPTVVSVLPPDYQDTYDLGIEHGKTYLAKQLWDLLGFSVTPEPMKVLNSCNRHHDCAKATDEYKAKHGQLPNFNFHCHSEDCEDCFGC